MSEAERRAALVERMARAIAPMCRWEKAEPSDAQLEDMEYARQQASRALDLALEEAAKMITNDCHDDMTREEEAAAIRALKSTP